MLQEANGRKKLKGDKVTHDVEVSQATKDKHKAKAKLTTAEKDEYLMRLIELHAEQL